MAAITATWLESSMPGSPLSSGLMKVGTATFTGSSSSDTLTVGPLSVRDQVIITPVETNTASGYAGLCELYASRSVSMTNGTITIVPIATAPDADVDFWISVRRI